MALNDRNPFGRRTVFADGPFFGLQREMNKLFDDMVRGFRPGPSNEASVSRPRLDVHESDSEFCVVADLPGVTQADVDVRVDGSNIVISAERPGAEEQKQQNYHLNERSHGFMRRTVQLPFAPDPDQVHANYENGVLTVHVPKQERRQSGRKVEVRAGSRSSAGGGD